SDGETANICIGQGQIAVTPLQMAVMISAIANGGRVLWPRLVDRIESMEPMPGQPPTVFASRQTRDYLGVKDRSLAVLREAMLADVEAADGTGRAAAIPGMRICGKTGTAQVTNPGNEVIDHTTWFASFAPYEAPKYAVIVMIESGGSGGGTCAPIARKIYLALQERDSTRSPTLARQDTRR
ncbi:MAG TPA: penicillin-binding transpeptidase domain-containing protein, partial [Clostridia bacterium]|nr:penicillin-binding transpeptidase domain-containing protein [Clostridia bacterium]